MKLMTTFHPPSYAPCPDVRQVVTPDLKCQNDEDSILFLVDLSAGKCRLGGSSLAQCYNQIGDSVPDLDDPLLLAKAFNVTQQLIKGCNLINISAFNFSV